MSRLQRSANGYPFGGVVLFSSARAQRGRRKARGKFDASVSRLTGALQSVGLAVLHVDLPTGDSSRGQKRSSKNEINKSAKAAVEQVSAQCGENGHRVAVIAEGEAADIVVLGARAQWQVRSFVLLSGRLSRKSKDTLADWQDNPALCLVSSEDKVSLRDMTDVYFASKHADTDIQVFEGMGSGAQMIESWARQFPEREPLERAIADWLSQELSSIGQAREISFETEDGWRIFGNLLLPDANRKKAPGVILLHSGRSDRYVFAGLERLLVKAGFAVLNIDWRGRGKSINKGRYFDLSEEERASGKLDAKAAIEFLTLQNGVDDERVGLVGVVHGAEHAVRASVGDPRVKALALLTGYMPVDERESAYLTGGEVHVMYVSCEDHRQVTDAMRRLYRASSDKLTRLLMFEGGAIGYQLFELDDRLEPAIVEWLKEAMA